MKATVAVLTTLIPVSALAHPLHGAGSSFGVGHFLTDPFHLGVLALAVVGVVTVVRFLLRRRPWIPR